MENLPTGDVRSNPFRLGGRVIARPAAVGEGIFVTDMYDRCRSRPCSVAPGPNGSRQSAPGTQRHQRVQSSSGSDAFPHFFEWLNLREGAYAVGLEPSTHHVTGARAARDAGQMIWLEHGESRTYESRLRVHDGSPQVEETRQRIHTIQAQP